MKKCAFIPILLALNFLLSACNDTVVLQTETNKTNTDISVGTSFETPGETTIPTFTAATENTSNFCHLSTSAETVYIQKIVSVFNTIAPYSLPISKECKSPPQIIVTMPEHTTRIEEEAINLGKTLYEIDSDSILAKERIEQYTKTVGFAVSIEEIRSGQTSYGNEYILVSEAYGSHAPLCTAYIRVSANYIWSVSCSAEIPIERAESLLLEIAKNTVFNGTVEPTSASIEPSAKFSPVTLHIDRYRDCDDIYFDPYDDGTLSGQIELLLPANWAEITVPGNGTVYTNATKPETAFSPNPENTACPFPCFEPSNGLVEHLLYPETFMFNDILWHRFYGRGEYREESLTEGTTEQGLLYQLRREDIEDYATTHYSVIIRITNSFLYHFEVFCDLNDENLIHTILNSIRFIEN